MKVQECVNRNCKKTFYVENWRLGVQIQCEKCINKKIKNDKNINN